MVFLLPHPTVSRLPRMGVLGSVVRDALCALRIYKSAVVRNGVDRKHLQLASTIAVTEPAYA
ncbi:hypothetical protein GCM10009547_16350 [Sporichthya brevicatena]|uniref:Uncharacterized protein n=1 Tax=Sporichthya brevicatena TaxID=171442 RepID=A0ABP3RWC6_9ACTN